MLLGTKTMGGNIKQLCRQKSRQIDSNLPKIIFILWINETQSYLCASFKDGSVVQLARMSRLGREGRWGIRVV
jgi:hypothetical protein